MSPTMTEGGIASWKKQEGETFAAGDVLLEIETDKATIDVEAQDDGVLAKIVVSTSSQQPVGSALRALAAVSYRLGTNHHAEAGRCQGHPCRHDHRRHR